MVYANFNVNGIEYIVQDDINGSYKEIVYKKSGCRPHNQKKVMRDYGLDVSTNANIENTHMAIERLLVMLMNHN